MNESSAARRLRIFMALAVLAVVAGGAAGAAAGCAASGDEQDEASGAQAQDLGGTLRQKKHIANIKWTPGKFSIGASLGKAMDVSFACAGTKAPYDLVQTTEKGVVVVASLAGCDEGDLVTLYKVKTVDGACYQVVSIDDKVEATSDVYCLKP